MSLKKYSNDIRRVGTWDKSFANKFIITHNKKIITKFLIYFNWWHEITRINRHNGY